MTFTDDINRHNKNVRASLLDLFVGTTQEVQRSITEGSPITGSPGLPRDTSHLFTAWQAGAGFTSEWTWFITPNPPVEYALSIEEGQQEPYTNAAGTLVTPGPIRRPYPSGGGPHSVKMTRVGWQKIVDEMARRTGERISGVVVR